MGLGMGMGPTLNVELRTLNLEFKVPNPDQGFEWPCCPEAPHLTTARGFRSAPLEGLVTLFAPRR
jgi:hypothetical protein